MTLSVIVPVYNVAPYLRACLDSLVAAARFVGVQEFRSSGVQKFRGSEVGVEVICVDDGSTDGSAEILEEVVSSLGFSVQSSGDNSKLQTLNFKLIRQANAGVSAARNAALDVATGDWIGFVDADDTVSERWFEVALELIKSAPKVELVKIRPLVSVKDEQGPTGISRHERLWINREEAIAKARLASVRGFRAHMGADARVVGLKEYSRYGWSMPNFIRRDLIGELRFPMGIRLKEDVCFFVQLANRLTCWVEAEFPGYFYTRRDGSAVMRHRSDEDSLKFVNAMLTLISLEFRVQSLEFNVQSSGSDVENSKLETLNSKHKTLNYRQAVSTAIGYEFVQWAEERDPKLPYDSKACPIRAAWRKAWEAGLIDLGDMPFFWRPCIWLWVKSGILWPTKITRRLRERLPW